MSASAAVCYFTWLAQITTTSRPLQIYLSFSSALLLMAEGGGEGETGTRQGSDPTALHVGLKHYLTAIHLQTPCNECLRRRRKAHSLVASLPNSDFPLEQDLQDAVPARETCKPYQTLALTLPSTAGRGLTCEMAQQGADLALCAVVCELKMPRRRSIHFFRAWAACNYPH